MRTMRSSESVCSCSKPPPRQSRRSPDETSKTKKKHHTRDKALPGLQRFSPLHRFNRIKATDTQRDFVGCTGRRSSIDYTSISLQTSSPSLPSHPCHQKIPPFQDQKFEDMALLYKLKLLRFFPAIFCYIEFQILFSLHVYLAYCSLDFLLAKRF